MARYYAQVTGNATITTNFKPNTVWTNNNNYLRLEYNGDITTTAGGICPFFAGQSPWFCLVQDDLNQYDKKQYLNIGSTVYIGTGYSWNTNGFESTTVMTFGNGTVSIVKGEQSYSGNFSGNIPNNNLGFFSNYANNLQMNFYELKVYGENDTLLYDFVPDLSGATKGIYDKVNEEFFAATNQNKMTLAALSTFEISPSALSASYTSGSTAITVDTGNDTRVTWTASTSNSWISLTNPTGTGDGSVTVTYSANSAFQDRSGSVIFTSSNGDILDLTVEQEKKPLIVYDRPIYRSGDLVKKMYRSGDLIYYRLNPEAGPCLTLSPVSGSVTYSGSVAFSATYKPKCNRPETEDITNSATWSVSPTGFGSVSNGVFTADNQDTASTSVTITAVYSGLSADSIVEIDAYIPVYENWVDLTSINNSTPIYNIAWLSDQGFSTINDTWFCEIPGLTTDSAVDQQNGWSSGKTADKGYYTYHRMSNSYKKYSCTFLDQYYTGNGANVEYGVAMTDASISQLPTGTINGNTYYMLNIVDWQNWKPLYMPLSTSKIQSTYVEGKILVDIAPKT